MCGIVGIVDFSTDVSAHWRECLKAMNDSQSHRGPDGEGYYFNHHIGLGHKRLAVIDIAHGQQPMKTADGGLILIYNGEIYNFLELRRTLEKEGYHFETASDTEVLLKAYQAWGKECLSRFNGDFAFAIWDETRQELFLARDRLGVKPLHYTRLGDSFLFSSEAKALLKFPGIPRIIDSYALIESLAYFQPLVPGTFIKNIQILEPGHYLIVRRDGVEKVQYWNLSYTGSDDNFEQTKQRISWLLEDATKLRMISDVPICGLLSGGLDSSILCTLMSDNSADRINTFSIDFKDNAPKSNRVTHIHDEDLNFAKVVAKEINAIHHPIVMNGDDYFELLPRAVYAREMPVALGSEVGIYRLCQEVKKHATVALSGEGADEIALGYYMFVSKEAIAGKLSPFFVIPANRFMFILNPMVRAKLRPIKYIQNKFYNFLENMPTLWDKEEYRNLNTMHYLQIKYVLPYLLDRADRLSMAASVELRVPFCDHRLVEYFFNIDPALKLTEGIEKYVLRESFRGRVYQEVLERKKSIFPYPLSDNELQKLFDATLNLFYERDANAKKIRKLYIKPFLKLLEFLAKRGKIPTIGAHFMFTFILTSAYLCKLYDLDFDFG